MHEDAGDVALIPGLGRSPGGRNGNPLQFSCLENPMDRGAWWLVVCGVAKSWIQLRTYRLNTQIKLIEKNAQVYISSVQLLSHVQLFATHGL